MAGLHKFNISENWIGIFCAMVEILILFHDKQIYVMFEDGSAASRAGCRK
jgi:hypothetical protein